MRTMSCQLAESEARAGARNWWWNGFLSLENVTQRILSYYKSSVILFYFRGYLKNKYESTVDQEPHNYIDTCSADSWRTLLYQRRLADVMAAILKVWRHIKNPTPSIDAYLLEEQCAKFRPYPIWNDGPVGFFKQRRSNKKKNNNNKYRYGISSWSKNVTL